MACRPHGEPHRILTELSEEQPPRHGNKDTLPAAASSETTDQPCSTSAAIPASTISPTLADSSVEGVAAIAADAALPDATHVSTMSDSVASPGDTATPADAAPPTRTNAATVSDASLPADTRAGDGQVAEELGEASVGGRGAEDVEVVEVVDPSISRQEDAASSGTAPIINPAQALGPLLKDQVHAFWRNLNFRDQRIRDYNLELGRLVLSLEPISAPVEDKAQLKALFLRHGSGSLAELASGKGEGQTVTVLRHMMRFTGLRAVKPKYTLEDADGGDHGADSDGNDNDIDACFTRELRNQFMLWATSGCDGMGHLKPSAAERVFEEAKLLLGQMLITLGDNAPAVNDKADVLELWRNHRQGAARVLRGKEMSYIEIFLRFCGGDDDDMVVKLNKAGAFKADGPADAANGAPTVVQDGVAQGFVNWASRSENGQQPHLQYNTARTTLQDCMKLLHTMQKALERDADAAALTGAEVLELWRSNSAVCEDIVQQAGKHNAWNYFLLYVKADPREFVQARPNSTAPPAKSRKSSAVGRRSSSSKEKAKVASSTAAEEEAVVEDLVQRALRAVEASDVPVATDDGSSPAEVAESAPHVPAAAAASPAAQQHVKDEEVGDEEVTGAAEEQKRSGRKRAAGSRSSAETKGKGKGKRPSSSKATTSDTKAKRSRVHASREDADNGEAEGMDVVGGGADGSGKGPSRASADTSTASTQKKARARPVTRGSSSRRASAPSPPTPHTTTASTTAAPKRASTSTPPSRRASSSSAAQLQPPAPAAPIPAALPGLMPMGLVGGGVDMYTATAQMMMALVAFSQQMMTGMPVQHGVGGMQPRQQQAYMRATQEGVMRFQELLQQQLQQGHQSGPDAASGGSSDGTGAKAGQQYSGTDDYGGHGLR